MSGERPRNQRSSESFFKPALGLPVDLSGNCKGWVWTTVKKK
jgi:hypothetical protein